MEKRQVNLVADIPGLVAIFGEALYKDFGSIVRELVQNAHDTVIELAASSSAPAEEIREHEIQVNFDERKRTLLVADKGFGMSEETMSQSLNNFARSKKRDLQKALAEAATTASAKALLRIVGEYGVGFLSAMAVSQELEVWSRTSQDQPVQWSYSKGKTSADIQEVSDEEFDRFVESNRLSPRQSGTIVRCKLTPSVLEDYSVDEDEVRQSLIQYAALLPVPIKLNGESLSCKYAAWGNPELATEADWREAIQGMHNEEPVLIIPVYSSPADLDIQGVLWIPERTSYFSEPSLDVYVKRMFVLTDDGIIMPSWARFLSGMINANKVRRIVSGNTIKIDKTSSAIKAFLKARIIEEFRKLRSRPEREYWQIISPHDNEIKGSAADDDDFRANVWDKLRFRSGDRKLTVPEYLAAVARKTGNDKTVYFYDQRQQQHSADLVSESTGVPILDLDQTRDDILVRKISADNDYELRSFRELAEELFRRPEDDSRFTSLVAACANWNIDAEVRDYSPSYLPAVLIEDQSFSQRRDHLLRGLKEQGEEHFAKDLEKLFKRQRAANFGVSFYLNSSNGLIQSLASADFTDQLRVCLALYNTSFMAAVPTLTESERKTIYESISIVFHASIGHAELNQTADSLDVNEIAPMSDSSAASSDSGEITIFLITPFLDEYRKIEIACRNVFEAPPYYFKLVLARDYTYNSSLFINVQSHIRRADAYLAEITDLNPNVMLELGAVLFAGEGKPVFSLRGETAKGEVPSDLKAELYIPYGAITDQTTEIEDRIRSALQRDGRPTHAGVVDLLKRRTKKTLSKTLLARLSYRLSDDEIDRVLGDYSHVEDFLLASRDSIVKRTGLRGFVIDALQGELREMKG